MSFRLIHLRKSFSNQLRFNHIAPWLILLCVAGAGNGCQTAPRPGTFEPRRGDEIVVAGQMVHTGTPVVLWLDPGGYDAYRVERRFSAYDRSDWNHSQEDVPGLQTPNRYGLRRGKLTNEVVDLLRRGGFTTEQIEQARAEGVTEEQFTQLRRGGLTDNEIEKLRRLDLTQRQLEQVRGGGWDLPLLQEKVDQFVIHFDVAGVSRNCFKTLQDNRDLSVHFMLDIDGTIYQTLDLKERAYHATIANTRSVGIEIANMGGYAKEENNPLDKWYRHDANGQTTLTIPPNLGDGGVRTPGFVGHPARPEPVKGNIQGRDLTQYDFTPQQYAALVKLTATLCKVFPKIQCRYPTDDAGKLITHKLPDDELRRYEGVLGHYHIQTDKVDPGPAFNWDYVIDHARRIMNNGLTPTVNEMSNGGSRSRF